MAKKEKKKVTSFAHGNSQNCNVTCPFNAPNAMQRLDKYIAVMG
jgi:hypothetical protein